MAFCVDTMGAVGDSTEVHSTARNVLGSVRLFSDGYHYIYLQGVASLAANDWVTFNNAFQSERLHSTTAKHGGCAIAQSAPGATEYGWFGFIGTFTASCESSIVSNGFCFAMATAGRVDDAVIKNKMIFNAITRTAGVAAGTATVQISRPWLGNFIESV